MRAVLPMLVLLAGAVACSSDLDCSLNGLCQASACVCDAPWSGPACAQLAYATTAASAKSLFPIADQHNTWGGPLVGPDEGGVYHAYVPLYQPGSLWHVVTVMHGVAAVPTGPWTWGANVTGAPAAINPGFLAFPNASGATVYSLWVGGEVLVADSLQGPFVKSARYDAINPSPVFHEGSFYLVTQHTLQVLTAPAIGGPWTVYANISHPSTMQSTVEDPFFYVDPRGRFHIVNHAYNTSEITGCGVSHVSAHWFSLDAMDWHWSDAPYGHTVQYDDGSTVTYPTLERPFLLFNAEGRPAFLLVAADISSTNGDCPRAQCCACCKFGDHDGTIVITLAV
jgi:hypothetical protein